MASVSRRIAFLALLEYETTRQYPDVILNRLIEPDINVRDRNLAWEMTMGTIRHLKRLDFVARSYIDAPLSMQKPEIITALRLGLYQLTEMDDIPDFAAVDETVTIAREQISGKAAGFINAVLRNHLRNPGKPDFPNPDKDPLGHLSVVYSFPRWLVKRWLGGFGFEETKRLLASLNQRPIISLKILEGKVSSETVIASMREDGIEISAGKFLPDFITTSDRGAVLQSRQFRRGNIIIQDESQGIPLYLLDPPKGAAVLDLCAAPGGKTMALADKVGADGKVTAVDIDAERLGPLTENLKRTRFTNVDIVQSDLFEFASSEKFKYILVDVPCSGLGTISVNPDVKWSKTEKDIRSLSRLQARMLERASTLLADGGNLVYSTCTTEPEEIEEVVNSFVDSRGDFCLENGNQPVLQPFKTDTGIYRSWPHRHGIGGGGFARLKKR
jgi:16S rRNA (cytosine967-C5)-methyltransferase